MSLPPWAAESALAAMRAGTLRAPPPRARAPAGACSYSADAAFSPGGVYVNLASLTAAAPRFLALDRARTGACVYLHVRSTRVASPAAPAAAPVAQAAAPAAVLAVTPDAPAFDVITEHALVFFRTPPLPLAAAAAAAGAPGEPALGETAAAPLPSAAAAALPDGLLSIVRAVLALEAAGVATDAPSAAWEDRPAASRHAAVLPQVPHGASGAGKPISPHARDWRCDAPGCGRTENLWLNLSDGFMGCGRANFDGSGGKGHALAHFTATRFPLCVKLGTITAAGGDCYSYAPDEDDSVENPHLAKHLAWFGIRAGGLEKTEKTVAELSLDLNASYDWSRLTESGADLELVTGPGRIGLDNLGNTCYINATLQALAAVTEWAAPLGGDAPALLAAAPREARDGDGGLRDDFLAQTARVLAALHDARYALPAPAAAPAAAGADAPPPPAPGGACGYVVPRALRMLVGRGHADFSTGRQQDAPQFIEWFFQLAERAAARGAPAAPARAPPPPVSDFFRFRVETRVQCEQTGGVRYMESAERFLTLGIPLEAAENFADIAAATRKRADAVAAAAAAGDDAASAKRARIEAATARGAPTDAEGLPLVPKPRIPLAAALAAWAAETVVDDYLSPATGARGRARKASRLLSLPPYLLVVLGRYTLAADWSQKKIDADVPMPLALDLAAQPMLAPPGGGLQPGEAPLVDAAGGGGGGGGGAQPPAAAPAVRTPDAELVARLVSMGFPDGACARAALAAPAGDEAATEWLIAHMDDADFAAPFAAAAPAAPAAAPGAAAAAPVDAGAVALLGDMGFEPGAAERALRACGGDLERATDWLFSRADGGAGEDAAAAGASAAAAAPAAAAAASLAVPAAPAAARYELSAVISHMGASTGTGHYVAHVRKDAAGRALGAAPDAAALEWLLFNDAKVARSKNPPLEAGYVYLYKRAV